MECRKHPKYKGKRKPVSHCIACWCKYLENTHKNYPMNLTFSEGTFLIESLGSEAAMELLIRDLKIDHELILPKPRKNHYSQEPQDDTI